MIFACVAFTDGGFHKTREGWQDIDGRIDTFVVELAVNENLTFSDVACKIRNRMCNIYNRRSACSRHGKVKSHTVVGHSQNGNLRD